MQLLKAHISNFKLLEDVEFDFSTERKRPLTVIRAENGSGKTSLLYALAWGFYGKLGLPEDARDLRIISSNSPAGIPVTVQVTIEFEHSSQTGLPKRYRLVRTATETPLANSDRVKKGPQSVRLVHLTKAGDEEVDQALLEKLLPRRLMNIFFTNGEDVQTFIAGAGAGEQQQVLVRDTIRALLGLDALEEVAIDVNSYIAKVRSKASKMAGADVANAELVLAQAEKDVIELESEQESTRENLVNMREVKSKAEKELRAIQGIGDLDLLNEHIAALEQDLDRLDSQRADSLTRLREALSSESFTWSLAGPLLTKGLEVLEDLADQHVIPGVSIEVLHDRLSLGTCICGESLDATSPSGATRREHIRHIIDEQRRTSNTSSQLTATFHKARNSRATYDASEADGHSFWEHRSKLISNILTIRDSTIAKNTALRSARERRAQIDDNRVRELTERIQRIEAQIGARERQLGEVEQKIRTQSALREELRRARDEAEKKTSKHHGLILQREIAEDLQVLAKGTLNLLQGDYVQHVGALTSELFMEIVGSDPAFEATVFLGVHIDPDTFNIVIETQGGKHLDPAFELNGASQRALTLAFIWAVTEVSGTSAPRIIDTPLGMVAGGVKRRMVEVITKPSSDDTPEYQVVLLLTGSEIRDIEHLIDERAGAITTMSCSKDYPTDLVYRWDTDYPVVRTCGCDHRHSCRTCARKYDKQHGVEFVDHAEVLQ